MTVIAIIPARAASKGMPRKTLPKDMSTCDAAWRLGAKIIEKHFTFDKTLPGNDHYHSMDKSDAHLFYQRINEPLSVDDIKKDIRFGCEDIAFPKNELSARKNARRSLVSARRIERGELIQSDMLISKRPASGICPSQIDSIVGCTAKEDIPEDTVLIDSMLNHLSSR